MDIMRIVRVKIGVNFKNDIVFAFESLENLGKDLRSADWTNQINFFNFICFKKQTLWILKQASVSEIGFKV